MVPHRLGDDRRLLKEWSLDQIKEIQLRRYIQRKTAVEIFLLDGQSLLFNFPEDGPEQLTQQLVKLKKSKCPNLNYKQTFDAKKLYEKQNLLKKWHSYEISTFEYLMMVNTLAGRSYKDISQYPVFPWILADYKSEQLNVQNPLLYRDFSKPMGALGSQDRLTQYMQRFSQHDGIEDEHKFHYGSHYSSPGIVFQMLVRVAPFTEGAISLQNGKFDLPERLFYSVEDSYRCSNEELSDIRELIPDFYQLPEMYLNLAMHDFRVQQNGYRVHNVQLPAWANQNPYAFVVGMRKMLESDYTSRNIHSWIDLVFGFKQRGREAEKATNVFYYLTYEDNVDVDSIEDQEVKDATETQILNFGQTPAQLFTKQHPPRNPREQAFAGKIAIDEDAELKVYRPTQQKKQKAPTSGPSSLQDAHTHSQHTIPDRAIIKFTWLSESRFICILKSGLVQQYK